MGNQKKAEITLNEIADNQDSEGAFKIAETSITRSSGKNLIIETTSLALLGMIRICPEKYTENIKKAVDFLVLKMNGGYFGSTQATILAMRALVEFMSFSGTNSTDLNFEVDVNAQKYLITVGESNKGKLYFIFYSLS